MNFEDLLRELENGKTFEEVFKEDEGCMVGRIGNVVYEDDDLYEFLHQLGAGIVVYGDGYVVIETENDKVYKVPYKEMPNRFDKGLLNETVLFFEVDRIYEITTEYYENKYKALLVFENGCIHIKYNTYDTITNCMVDSLKKLIELMDIKEYYINYPFDRTREYSIVIKGEDKAKAEFIRKFIDNGYKLIW